MYDLSLGNKFKAPTGKRLPDTHTDVQVLAAEAESLVKSIYLNQDSAAK
jgi:hypothetical protein